METLPSRPKHLPKAPVTNTITLGITISTCEFGGEGAQNADHNTSYVTSGNLSNLTVSQFLHLHNEDDNNCPNYLPGQL